MSSEVHLLLADYLHHSRAARALPGQRKRRRWLQACWEQVGPENAWWGPDLLRHGMVAACFDDND